MYDNWSEEIRNAILTNLENEATKFAQACAENGERIKGIAILQKVAKIVPDSAELKNLSATLAAN